MLAAARYAPKTKVLLARVRRTLATACVSGINSVGVVGLGLMGHGIAQMVAMAGYPVVGVELQQQALETGKGRIHDSLSKLLAREAKKGKITQAQAEEQRSEVLSRISFSADFEAIRQCDMVVEAIAENMDLKLRFYENLSQHIKPEAIFASNTSSLPITAMAIASKRPDRFVGMHFFNPVQIMKLVEVIRTEHTDTSVFETSKNFVESIGKTAVSCKDTPGFIVNRLLIPFIAQALLLIDRGDASIEDTDVSLMLGAGHPMGPITLADYVGLDTTLNILEGWRRAYPNEPAFVVPLCLKVKVDQGHLGRKSGRGFYHWNGDQRGALAA